MVATASDVIPLTTDLAYELAGVGPVAAFRDNTCDARPRRVLAELRGIGLEVADSWIRKIRIVCRGSNWLSKGTRSGSKKK